ncbi:MAG: DNA polymerase I [Proteobacteria bacterium]|nr:DNA polymerase I [Pseudomonadota bacterium]
MTEARDTPRKLVVFDGANTLFRAFFAIPHLRAPDGTPTNAAYGFINTVIKVLREESPDFVAVAYDARGGTFRHRMYRDYKAGRDATPEDLSAQLPLARELVAAHGLSWVEVPDYEADDVIATLVAQAPEDVSVIIVSTDKDLMQLVSDRVILVDGIKDRRYGPAEVEERFGVPPEQILDLRALVGDPSDNIPGVKGIGEKGAAKLITEWKSLERLLEHASDVKAKRAREALETRADEARLSKELSTLRYDVPLPVVLDDLARREPETAQLRELYQKLGFTRLLEALDPGASSAGAAAGDDVEVEIVKGAGELECTLAGMGGDPLPVIAILGAGSAVDAPLLGLAFASADDRAHYAPLGDGGVDPDAVLEVLRAWFASEAGHWIAASAKDIHTALGERGLELPASTCDVSIAAFLLDPAGAHQTWALSSQYLGRSLESWEDLAGRGAKAVPAVELPVEKLGRWAGQQACAVRALAPILRERLEADGLLPLFAEVEMPLTRVLSQVERNGVRIDEALLAALSEEYEKEQSRIEAEIYTLAGGPFKVNSPKQLQQILFEKLKLPVIKKTKTGYSTDEGVLEQLAAHHELPTRILAWRRLAKLVSTYIDALPPLVSERSGRIHPEFNQTGAATGRLSASNPNVQNIPIRTEEGVRIREAFIPAEGCALLSADYSQIELRILAHYSGDESLIQAFRNGEDIHRRTAAEVEGLDSDAVGADARTRAKAVNFGIIYGLSAFGLANQLGIATGEAQETIDAYFARYPGVRRFLDETVSRARERGFVSTLLGRRRYLPDLGSRNRVLRQAAERMAVNTVIQGSEADLTKKAMIVVQAALREEGLGAKMILQVHDELVFEVPRAEVEATGALARERMEGVFPLDVPLVVDIGVGANWREAH